MKNVAVVIFDMDGVIVDSEPLHERAFRDVFDEMGMTETHGVDFAEYYGRSDEALWRDFIQRHRPAQSLQILLGWKRSRFLALLDESKPIYQGLPSLLERLASRYPLGLASGSPHEVINGVLGLQGLRRWFKAVVSAEDVPREKPAPDIFLRTAELMQVQPSVCCVVEDSAAGVAAARAAGMQVIAITNSLPASRLARAHHVVDSYGQIERLLLG